MATAMITAMTMGTTTVTTTAMIMGTIMAMTTGLPDGPGGISGEEKFS
jgi:hypothetical protein